MRNSMQEPISLEISIKPLSINAMYRTFRGRTILSEEGREFKRNMAAQLEKAKSVRKLTGSIRLSAIFSFDDNRRRDVDNYAKATLDSLIGVLFDDDSQISELHLYKLTGCEKDGIRIECSPI